MIDFDKSAFQNKINNISKIVYKIEVGKWKAEEEKQHWISFYCTDNEFTAKKGFHSWKQKILLCCQWRGLKKETYHVLIDFSFYSKL